MKANFLLKSAMSLLLAFLCAHSLHAHNDSATAYLGVWYQHVSKKKAKFMEVPNANDNGVLIEGIAPGSPADLAGLEFMDYMYEFNGVTLSEDVNWDDLFDEMSPGESVTMKVVRQKETLNLRANLVSRLERQNGHYNTNAFLGVEYKWEENKQPDQGAWIDVIEGTTAERIGLKDGDIIVGLNDYEIYDWHDLGVVIDNSEPGSEFCVTYLRDGEEFRTCDMITKRNETPENYEEMEEELEAPLASETEAPEAPEASEAIEPEPGIVLKPSIPTPVEGREIQGENGLVKLFEDEVSSVKMVDMTEDEVEMMEDKFEMDMPERGIPYRDLNVYPNPNDGRFTFFIDLEKTADADLRITDAQGRLVYEESIPGATGRIERRLDISGRAKGIYFVIVLQGNKSITKRVVVD